MNGALITMDQAAAHLRLDLVSGDEREADLSTKMEQATDIVLDYIKNEGSGWDAETVPRPIHAAILITLSALWDDREGELLGKLFGIGGTCETLLARFRDPAIA